MPENTIVDKKTISITGKRQITIPQKFFEALDFGNEAECILQNGAIVIRPVKENSGGEFAEQILADLISQGYSGPELLDQFRQMQKKIRPAIKKIIEEAREAAYSKGEFLSYDDVFNQEEE